MPRVHAQRPVALGAAVTLVGTLLAALLLAVSGAGSTVGATSAHTSTGTSTAQTSTAKTSTAHGSSPARAHGAGHLGGKHARVGTTSSVTDHLKVQHLDLTATPPTDGVDLPRSSHGAADVVAAAPVAASTPRPDSRGPPAA